MPGNINTSGNGVNTSGGFIAPPPGPNAPFAMQLPKWRLALGKFRNGERDAKIACVGDSTTAGYPGTGSYSFPSIIASALNARGYAATAKGGFLSNSGLWTSTGSWQNGPYGPCGFCWQGLSTNGALVATPGIKFDSADVYFLGNTNLGNFSGQITGMSSATTIAGNASQGQYKVTLGPTGVNATVTSNTITFNGLSSSQSSYLTVVEPFLSGTKQIRVANFGANGSTIAAWDDASVPAVFGATNFLPLYAPDLTLVSLGKNDVYQGGASFSLSASMASFAALIATIQAAGSDVVCVTMPPSSSGSANETALVAAQIAFCNANGIAVIDEFNRLGGTYQTAFMSDPLHPNAYGYSDWGNFIVQTLVQL